MGRGKADDFKSKMYNIMTSFNLNIQEDAFALGAAAVAHGAQNQVGPKQVKSDWS